MIHEQKIREAYAGMSPQQRNDEFIKLWGYLPLPLSKRAKKYSVNDPFDKATEGETQLEVLKGSLEHLLTIISSESKTPVKMLMRLRMQLLLPFSKSTSLFQRMTYNGFDLLGLGGMPATEDIPNMDPRAQAELTGFLFPAFRSLDSNTGLFAPDTASLIEAESMGRYALSMRNGDTSFWVRDFGFFYNEDAPQFIDQWYEQFVEKFNITPAQALSKTQA